MSLNLDTSEIVALAFVAMEKTPPASFSDDSEEAALTTRFYAIARDRCLEGGDWSFASVYAALPELVPVETVTPDPALPYLYALPGDCLRLREVGDGTVKFRVDAIGLRADQSAPLPVRYTARITTESRTPVSFRAYVAAQLAVLLAPRFLGTSNKIEVLKRDLSDARTEAEREDSRTASEARYDGLPDQPDWATEAITGWGGRA